MSLSYQIPLILCHSHDREIVFFDMILLNGGSRIRHKRPECPHYDACANFVDAMQHRHKHVTPGEFPNYIILFGKNVCAGGSTSGNIQCGMGSTESVSSVTLTGDLFCDGATTSPFIVLMPSWIVMDTKSLAPTSNDAVSLFGSPMVHRRLTTVRLVMMLVQGFLLPEMDRVVQYILIFHLNIYIVKISIKWNENPIKGN